MAERTLWVKDEYLQHILSRRKTIEVRVGYPNIRRLRAGDAVLFNGRHRFIIARIAMYASFEDLLQAEEAARIAPDLPPGALLAGLRAIYPAEKEALGVYALELRPAEQP
jgi:ASC-1-like (ASCH) protein